MIGAVATWFVTSKIGRFIAAAGALLLAIVTFGAWQRGKGAASARQKQQEKDHAAVEQANRAGAEYRAGGDVADRMRRGEF